MDFKQIMEKLRLTMRQQTKDEGHLFPGDIKKYSFPDIFSELKYFSMEDGNIDIYLDIISSSLSGNQQKARELLELAIKAPWFGDSKTYVGDFLRTPMENYKKLCEEVEYSFKEKTAATSEFEPFIEWISKGVIPDKYERQKVIFRKVFRELSRDIYDGNKNPLEAFDTFYRSGILIYPERESQYQEPTFIVADKRGVAPYKPTPKIFSLINNKT